MFRQYSKVVSKDAIQSDVLFLFNSLPSIFSDEYFDHLWTGASKIELRADIIYRFTDLLLLCSYHPCVWMTFIDVWVLQSEFRMICILRVFIVMPSQCWKSNKNQRYDVDQRGNFFHFSLFGKHYLEQCVKKKTRLQWNNG